MELVNDFTVNRADRRGLGGAHRRRAHRPVPARCAQLQEIEGDVYRGIVKIKVGPDHSRSSRARPRSSRRTTPPTRPSLKAEGRDTGGQGQRVGVDHRAARPAGRRRHRSVTGVHRPDHHRQGGPVRSGRPGRREHQASLGSRHASSTSRRPATDSDDRRRPAMPAPAPAAAADAAGHRAARARPAPTRRPPAASAARAQDRTARERSRSTCSAGAGAAAGASASSRSASWWCMLLLLLRRHRRERSLATPTRSRRSPRCSGEPAGAFDVVVRDCAPAARS